MPLFLSLMFFPKFCVLFLFPPFLPCSISISCYDCSSPLFHYSQLLPFILSTMVGFIIFTHQPLLARCGRPSKIAHWPTDCPATTITLYWLHHTSFPNKNGLSCLLPLFVFTTLIWIRVNLLPHLTLWHASSGSSSYLLLLGEMSSQQDIFSQKSLSGILKIDFLFLPIVDTTESVKVNT